MRVGDTGCAGESIHLMNNQITPTDTLITGFFY